MLSTILSRSSKNTIGLLFIIWPIILYYHSWTDLFLFYELFKYRTPSYLSLYPCKMPFSKQVLNECLWGVKQWCLVIRSIRISSTSSFIVNTLISSLTFSFGDIFLSIIHLSWGDTQLIKCLVFKHENQISLPSSGLLQERCMHSLGC